MSAQVWRVVRWVVALGACGVVVLVAVPMTIDAVSNSLVFGDAADDEGEPDDGEGAEPTEPGGEVPTGPVEDGHARATADFVVRDGVVSQAAGESLAISGGGDVAVTVFPLIDGTPDCVAAAELQVHMEAGDATELGVYAATIRGPLEDGDEVAEVSVDDKLRAVAVTDGSPGRLLWDVSAAYRAWASGELAPAGTPFAVVIAPSEASAALTFSSVEAGDEQAPTLRWEGDPDCGDEVV
ncbi:MAG: hypothetical protein WD250_00515 [Egibacteraceae bacterium]